MTRFRTEKDNFILECARGKRVLDVGCVNHTLEATRRPDWRHAQLKQVASGLTGLDYEKEIVAELVKDGWNVVAADCQDFDIRDRNPEGFDLIIASEVIEHLVNPGGFLKCAAMHLAPGGRVLITTPNAYGFGFFLETLVWNEERVNDDHTLTFSRKNMAWLMRKCGLRVAEFHWLIQDSSILTGVHNTAGAKFVAKIFFWLQCIAATIRPGFSKEMIVLAERDQP